MLDYLSYLLYKAPLSLENIRDLEIVMKPDIHPDYHEITVKMTNGDSFKTRSTYGEKGTTYQLDIDPNTHPAWTGGGVLVNERAGRIAGFNKKFGNINFGSAKKSDAKKAEDKNS